MDKPLFTLLNLFVLIAAVMCGSGKLNAETLALATLPTQHIAQSHPEPPHINAKAYLLVDADSGKVLAEKDPNKWMSPASLTKVMTVYVAASALSEQQISMTDRVKVSHKAWRAPGSKMFLKEGQTVSVKSLLEGIIVGSGNDASIAMAEFIAGSEANFVQIMNKYAQQLGMKNSYFSDATGLPNTKLHSTANDLAMLARAFIQQFPDDYAWFKQRWMSFNGIKQPNRNRLLWKDAAVDGMKTGHTEESAFSLIVSAKKNSMRLIAVVLGAPSDAARAESGQRLLNYGFRFYRTHQLYTAQQSIANIRVWKGEKHSVGLGLAEPLIITIPNNTYNDLSISTQVLQRLDAPVKQGQRVGKMLVKLKDQVIVERPLIALNTVDKGWLLTRLSDSVRSFLPGDDIQLSKGIS